ncbi:MAG: DUF6273 domain-containing protein [Lachnospiraceae bacterium]|nr:DUF6273 domain-containing protein [Lachnospiraceae bacterium]
MKKRTNMHVCRRAFSAVLAGVMTVGMVPQAGGVVKAGSVKADNVKGTSVKGTSVKGGEAESEKPVLYRSDSKVWFGNYPQAEVVPSENEYTAISADNLADGDLIVAPSLYNELKETKDWDIHGDTVIDGQKYRRVSKDKCCYGIAAKNAETDVYTWDEEQYHYFKYEPVQWKIYDSDEESYYLISEKIIENEGFFGRKYYFDDAGWEKSYIRSWLNGYGSESYKLNGDFTHCNFMDLTFSDSEKAAISTSTLKNDDNTQLGSSAYFNDVKDTNDTEDKIYLLSLSELQNKLGRENYSKTSSTYSKARGTVLKSDYFITRTISSLNVPLIWGETEWNVYSGGDYRGIYPAMKIAKSNVATVDIGSTNEIEPIAYDGKDTNYLGAEFELYNTTGERLSTIWDTTAVMNWNCIWMGSYMQTEADETTKAVLDGLENSDRWSDDDIVVGSNKYHRTLWEADGDAVYKYFKYEPVKWRIINSDGKNALVISDKNIESHKFNVDRGDNGPWENSSVRELLNDIFYDIAFNDTEKAAIMTSRVVDEEDNERNTMDNLYLMSNEEISSSLGLYAGFGNMYGNFFTYRPFTMEQTDYSKLGDSEYIMTRTPGFLMSNSNPAVSNMTANKYYNLRPVMCIDLTQTDAYQYAGTECSNGMDNEIPYVFKGEEPKVSVKGIQISAKNEGFRVVYSTTESENITERGMIYGLGDYCSDEDMAIDSESDYVYHFAATQKGKIGNVQEDGCQMYAMTMKLIKNKDFFKAPLVVRAYAVSEDGTVTYSDVESFDVYSVASYLYDGCLMAGVSDHNYLYNDILKVVNPEYAEMNY